MSTENFKKAVKEYGTNELGLGTSAQNIKRKEVANIQYKVRGPMETHLIGNSNIELDISEATLYLRNQGYKFSITQITLPNSRNTTTSNDTGTEIKKPIQNIAYTPPNTLLQ
ncbi:5744_t:CDS:2, partial [Ambispora gerdemannii]